MNCHHVHEEIRQILAEHAKPSAPLKEHMGGCAQCREHWQQQALEQWLPEVLVAPVPAQLQNRILAGVAASQPASRAGHKWPAVMAVAACLLVMILLGPLANYQSSTQVQLVEVSVGQLDQVQLLVASAQDYTGANMTVTMTEGMTLDAAGRVSEFSMKTSLRAGKNMLALPVYLLHEEGGRIEVQFSLGDGTKKIQLDVKAKLSNQDKPTQAI